MSKKKLITLLLALTMILSLAVGASAAETTEAKVPVTLTVVNTVAPISCTVPACLPVSLVDGYVVCANNAAITNTGKTACAFRATTIDAKCDAVLACRKIVKISDFKRTCLHVNLCDFNCTVLSSICDGGVICTNDVAIYQRHGLSLIHI